MTHTARCILRASLPALAVLAAVAIPALAQESKGETKADEDNSRSVRILDAPPPPASVPSQPPMPAPPMQSPAAAAGPAGSPAAPPPAGSGASAALTPTPTLTPPAAAPARPELPPAPPAASPPLLEPPGAASAPPLLTSPQQPTAGLTPVPTLTPAPEIPTLTSPSEAPTLTSPPETPALTAPPASTPATAAPSEPAPGSSDVAALPQTPAREPATPAELDALSKSVKVGNPAGLTVEILPRVDMTIGSKVSFRITAKKPGYIVLVDVDANGRLTQIYPNPMSLAHAGGGKPTNFIKPGKPLQLPDPREAATGFEFVASPPFGTAMVIAIFSDRPVQQLDLPDIPASMVGNASAVDYLTKLANELRIPESSGGYQEAHWSFDAKFYAIR